MDVRSGEHEPLLPSGPDRNPTDWSRDGRYILYEENAPSTSYDLWALEMPGRKPLPLVRESFNERSARLSPDGRLMAYVSDRTGTPEVYVRPFLDPDAGNEKKVSVTGGFAPRWSANGGQLFFYGLDQAVVAVDVDSGSAFTAGHPSQLFAIDMRFTCSRAAGLRCPSPPVTWEVLPGNHFLINASPTGPRPPTPPIRWSRTDLALNEATGLPSALHPRRRRAVRCPARVTTIETVRACGTGLRGWRAPGTGVDAPDHASENSRRLAKVLNCLSYQPGAQRHRRSREQSFDRVRNLFTRSRIEASAPRDLGNRMAQMRGSRVSRSSIRSRAAFDCRGSS
jgi:hypothetical protein